MEHDFIQQIERWGWGLLGVALLVTLLFGVSQQFISLGIGGVFSLLNFRGMCVFFQALLQRKWKKSQWIAGLGSLVYLGKYTFITLFFFYLIKHRMVDLLFLVVGLSIIVIAIIGVGIFQAITLQQGKVWKS